MSTFVASPCLDDAFLSARASLEQPDVRVSNPDIVCLEVAWTPS